MCRNVVDAEFVCEANVLNEEEGGKSAVNYSHGGKRRTFERFITFTSAWFVSISCDIT